MTVIETDLLQLAYPPRLDLGPQLTHEQLMSSMQATMAKHKGEPVWLFAYGSLIWRPECSSTQRMRARVHGYHRGLYLWTHEHRGTPELPGLVFGLDRGGSCSGFAYRLPEDQLEASLYALWQRDALSLIPAALAQLPSGRWQSGTSVGVCVGAAFAQLCRQLARYRAQSRTGKRLLALRHHARLCRADR